MYLIFLDLYCSKDVDNIVELVTSYVKQVEITGDLLLPWPHLNWNLLSKFIFS